MVVGLQFGMSQPGLAEGSDNFTKLDREVSLPDLPPFTGEHKFSTGVMFPDTHGGPAYVLRYSTTTRPTDVITWYRQALQSYGWKERSGNAYTIRASRDKAFMVVNVVSPLPGEKYSYTVLYRSAH